AETATSPEGFEHPDAAPPPRGTRLPDTSCGRQSIRLSRRRWCAARRSAGSAAHHRPVLRRVGRKVSRRHGRRTHRVGARARTACAESEEVVMSAFLIRVIVESSIRSALVAAAVALILGAFRLRDAGLRHRAWTTVLSAMLLMPALQSVAPSIA